MWDYLGRLQVEVKDYAEAEKSFKSTLVIIQLKPSSRPIDHLNAHNRLSWFYDWVGDIENEKKHLNHAIEYNRLVYEGDSTQEANCWQQLAEIEFTNGDTHEAIRILNEAITMKAGLEHTRKESLNYMKGLRKEWIATTVKKD